MKLLILSFIITFYLSLSLSADETICKKFDITCKSKNFLNDTMKYQKKAWSESPIIKKNKGDKK